MNKVQILDKIKRNLDQRGIAAVRNASDVTVAGVAVITCADASIQAPMGGIDGSVSPFLGIGVAAPGQIVVQLADTTSINITATMMVVLREAFGFANDVVIKDATDANVALAVPAHADWTGLGQ